MGSAVAWRTQVVLPPQLNPCATAGGVRQLMFASGSFDMDAGPLAALTSNEEVTLRRIAFGIGGGSTLRREDVSRLIKLQLVISQGIVFALTARGESRIAQR